MALISIIIPCYNDGVYLEDAFNSIQFHNYGDMFECIIIDDGSTDDFTIRKIDELQLKGCIIIHQENNGLAEARNAGIKISSGKYILPLDSDNKIIPEVFLEMANIMDHDNSIDVVYTDAQYFGLKEGSWNIGPYDGLKLLNDNYIDACALIRKSTILDLGMYDQNMPSMGNEDWELWLNFFLNNKKIIYLRKTGYYYRVKSDSMLLTLTGPNFNKNKQYIYKKYYSLISAKVNSLKIDKENLENQRQSLRVYFKKNKLKTIFKLFLGKEII